MNNEKITHIDLFSGIGGFALATEAVWGKENVEHIFCDIEPFSQAVLKKHWPEAKIYGDIRTLTHANRSGGGASESETIPHRSTDSQERKHTQSQSGGHIDILTGGFPCQPFSHAGRRKGTADERYLWPEMLRVIREFHPRWVIGENVGGLVTWNEGMVLEQVHLDLEAEGYEVQAFIIPAVAVNAPHRRDRVWIVAHSTSGRERSGQSEGDKTPESKTAIGNGNRNVADTKFQGREESRHKSDTENRTEAGTGLDDRYERHRWNQNWIEVATWYGRMDDGVSSWLDYSLRRINGTSYKTIEDKKMRTLQESLSSQEIRDTFGRLYSIPDTEVLLGALRGIPQRDYEEWSHATCSEMAKGFLREMWEQREAGRTPRGWRHSPQLKKEHQDLLPSLSYETSLALAEAWHCVRFALQNREDQDGYKLKGSRNPRLKALGNAIVPQVAEEIMRAIKGV